jgi:uncharacterized protein (TIGR03067 family)
MRRPALVLLTIGILIAAEPPNDDATKKDLKKLQGDWAAVSMVNDGVKASDDEAQSLFRTVKDNHYTVYLFNKAIGKGTFKIDATKTPKTIDAVPANAPDKSKAMLGIYELDGDQLKLCFASSGKDRPKDFTSKAGSGQVLTVWEREKK